MVDNRGGAGGSIGANAVAKSAADGRTLLMATVGTQAINPALYKSLPYDAVRDFTPIALVAVAPVAIVANPALKANSLAELVALAKSMPGKLNYGSAGPGTPGHLTAEMFKSVAGIDIQHVPYKGSAPAVTDLLGGQIQIMFDPLQSVLSNVQAGKLRAIAVSSKTRPSILPDVPTIAESGFAGFESTAWWGVFAPAGLSPDLTKILAGEIEQIVTRCFLSIEAGTVGGRSHASKRRCVRDLSARRTREVGQGRAGFWSEGRLMQLNDEEQDILAGKIGPLPQQALQHQIKVGDFFGARDLVPVSQAHIMADTESLGEAGVRWLEQLASLTEGQRTVRVPTITDPRGTDFAHAAFLGQTAGMLDLERRAIAAFVQLGVSMTDTCINYQTIQAPIYNEHVAFGDTGVVIYSNSICGARSNFEGGPSALAAGITGRTPRYGFHLPEGRRATLKICAEFTPDTLNDWGALGGVIGRIAGNYWAVPVIEGIQGTPRSDQLKHFGAAMASFGSTALFHIVGLTPEARQVADVAAADVPVHRVTRHDVTALQKSYHNDDTVDVVVFSAPQLSLFELRDLAALCAGRRFAVPLLAVTSPQVKPDSDRMGYTAHIENAGGVVMSGMCFYQSYAREIAEANGWKRLVTNSAKLVNILGGYGYRPMMASMEACVDAAVSGKLERI